MLGGIVKLTLLFNVLFLFIVLLWQAAIIDASPVTISMINLCRISTTICFCLDHDKQW